jgi:L-threonylcarbamoyladenylate synthase
MTAGVTGATTTDRSTAVAKADAAAIAEAVRVLKAGGLVAFPTETVYGLGADATNAKAVARLYAAKGRPSFNPLISHVHDQAATPAIARFNADAERLAAFWPGPLTLVLPKADDCPVSELALAGLNTIAVRVPSHPIARAMLAAFGKPVVAPSANRSGHVSPTEAAHVIADLDGLIDLVVDGGPTLVGVESTVIICCDGPTRLLRPGGLPRETIERALGHSLAAFERFVPGAADEAPIAPGMLASHYAPRAQLRLNATVVDAGEAVLAFGPRSLRGAPTMTLNLSERGDLVEAAANLFAHLRAFDAAGVTHVAVMPVPMQGLGEAINDRLARAAAPRP